MATSNGRVTTGSDDDRPDPTVLTTQQLDKAIAGLREILEARMNGADKAVQLLQGTADLFPARIDEKISALKELLRSELASAAGSVTDRLGGVQLQLHERDDKFKTLRELFDEKFDSVQKQFTERDTRVDQSSAQTLKAVDAAFAAAKEAVGKSETATLKSIDQLQQLIGEKSKASDEKIADVKDRVIQIESRAEGGTAHKQSGQQNIALIIAGIAVAVSLAFGFMNRPSTPTVITAPAVVPVIPNAGK